MNYSTMCKRRAAIIGITAIFGIKASGAFLVAGPLTDSEVRKVEKVISLAYTNAPFEFDFSARVLMTYEDHLIGHVREYAEEAYQRIKGSADPRAGVELFFEKVVGELRNKEGMYGGLSRYQKMGDNYRVDDRMGFDGATYGDWGTTHVLVGPHGGDEVERFYIGHDAESVNLVDDDVNLMSQTGLWRAWVIDEGLIFPFLRNTMSVGSAFEAVRSGSSENVRPDEKKLRRLVEGRGKFEFEMVDWGDGIVELSMRMKGSRFPEWRFVCLREDFSKMFFAGLFLEEGKLGDVFSFRQFDESGQKVEKYAYVRQQNRNSLKFKLAEFLLERSDGKVDPGAFEMHVPEGWTFVDRRGDKITIMRDGEVVKSVSKAEAAKWADDGGEGWFGIPKPTIVTLGFLTLAFFIPWLLGRRKKASAGRA